MNYKGFLIIIYLFAGLYVCYGCSNGKCVNDTNCKLPLVCISGECVNRYPPVDILLDTVEDENSDPFEEITTEITEPYEPGGEEISVDEVPTEDIEEEDIPPASIIWSEDFSSGSAERWECHNGGWSVAGGEYKQDLDTMSECWVPSTSWTDFAAEVSIVADSLFLPATRTVMGIMFRAEEIVSANNYYLCEADFNGQYLILLRYDNVSPGYHQLCISPLITPSLVSGTGAPWYKLQVVARGSRLTCRIAPAGDGSEPVVEISASDEAYAAGSIGVFTNRVQGRFDNVIVYDHTPPEWLFPTITSSCQ